ncbi:hypothetical protein L6452_02916 [Arctium lappa]|uniref:Uncharacterized protein n=1 Tax=Arctium lappa TaxID=4217 RepID=A0ACB9FKE3_ARCLA|nr:hypothetical protein L6452_02916 [Arctium lappa]
MSLKPNNSRYLQLRKTSSNYLPLCKSRAHLLKALLAPNPNWNLMHMPTNRKVNPVKFAQGTSFFKYIKLIALKFSEIFAIATTVAPL